MKICMCSKLCCDCKCPQVLNYKIENSFVGGSSEIICNLGRRPEFECHCQRFTLTLRWKFDTPIVKVMEIYKIHVYCVRFYSGARWYCITTKMGYVLGAPSISLDPYCGSAPCAASIRYSDRCSMVSYVAKVFNGCKWINKILSWEVFLS